VQSWKDSGDSMNHADGQPAPAPLSVAEVQGYAFAAFRAAAGFCRHLGQTDRAAALDARADRLAAAFHRRYWLEKLGTYAMAIDAHGVPLAVLSSDPGHLLWTGIGPELIAPRLVATLMGPELWSGWGLRTLGSNEARFNAASYHNGSVWPHDTALFAWGLHRYGFARELHTVGQALFDLAAALPDYRLSELVAGSARVHGLAPTRYAHACYPQAWAAASLPLLARLMADLPLPA
jgi:glycogen debranching enzyme